MPPFGFDSGLDFPDSFPAGFPETFPVFSAVEAGADSFPFGGDLGDALFPGAGGFFADEDLDEAFVPEAGAEPDLPAATEEDVFFPAPDAEEPAGFFAADFFAAGFFADTGAGVARALFFAIRLDPLFWQTVGDAAPVARP